MARLSLADFHTGDWVDVRGYEYPAGSGRVVATRVERIDEQGVHQMRGPFRNPDQPAFDILTVAIMTTDTTRFVLEGGTQITAAEYFAQPAGTLVEARGAWDGAVLAASQAIIKTCDD